MLFDWLSYAYRGSPSQVCKALACDRKGNYDEYLKGLPEGATADNKNLYQLPLEETQKRLRELDEVSSSHITDIVHVVPHASSLL